MMKAHRINIAIDGPSASGKGTIARKLAERLNYLYVDTGAMYRSFALYCQENNVNYENKSDLLKALKSFSLELNPNGSIFVNHRDVTDSIRTKEIALLTSKISTIADVRSHMVKFQQSLLLEKGCVMEGRDIGSVVMPNAELKVYQTASANVRAERRYVELVKQDPNLKYESVLEDIEARDYQDMNRENSPLTKAEDAIVVDTSNMSIDEVVNRLYQLAIERMN